MSSKGSSSLKELRGLREAVLAEEKVKALARMQNLPAPDHRRPAPPPPPKVVEPPAAEPVPDQEIADESESGVPFGADDPELESSSETSGKVSDFVPELVEPPVEEFEPSPEAIGPPPELEEPPVEEGESVEADIPFAEVAPPPPPAPIPVPPPPPPEPPAKPKLPKEPALIIPLTPRIMNRLKRNVENARWSPAQLVLELIQASLHQGYPSIQFGDQLVARSETYRIFERNPARDSLKITSGQGVFHFVATEGNPDYLRWLEYFIGQKNESPEKAAQQVCLFGLQSYLESVDDFSAEGWSKVISIENFSILPMDG
ncbi:MAG: hypothetical protein K9N62_19210 [Verrucomicrobia bacterium]|nr:hypothetical protein [Verrucomicrobiota bacterium]